VSRSVLGLRGTVPAVWLAATLWVAAGCGGGRAPEIDWEAFDPQQAFAHVEAQVAFGPRPSGSDALLRAGDYIGRKLNQYGLRVEHQVFIAHTPQGPVKFRNVIGRTPSAPPERLPIIIIGSHYDTKWMPEIEMVGANDAGSSTGVSLEMARVAAGHPNLWFVFFDGEECMHEYHEGDGLWGSRHFVRQLQRESPGLIRQIRGLILLDMVGDRDLTITIPANTTPWLVETVFDAARALGVREYFSFRNMEIIDDHVPFLAAGIPAVNIIDFEYGSAPGLNDYWHTEHDTLDKISARSLEIVGRTALKTIALLRQKDARR
jgi:glutaminyl-peptide cyclotransferase